MPHNGHYGDPTSACIEGVLKTMRSEPDGHPCACCPDGGHIFCYFIDVPYKTWTGADGDLTDWIHAQLARYKTRPGLRVTVTLEFHEADSPETRKR